MQKAVCVRRKTKSQKKSTKQNVPAQDTPRYPQQPGDRDHLETARDETGPTRSPMLTRFDRSRVCGNRPRTALAIAYGKNGLGRFVPSACFFYSRPGKREKKQSITATSNRHSDPHRASHSFKTARARWKESQTLSQLGEKSCRPLWARHRLSRRESRRY